MKRRIILLLFTMLTICLYACSSETNSGNKVDNTTAITLEEFKTYVSPTIELTTENWSEYFEIIEEEIDYEKDAFDEPTGNAKIRVGLHMKEHCYNLGEDVVIEVNQKIGQKIVITNLETKKVVSFPEEEVNYGEMTYTLDWETGGYIGNTYIKTYYPYGQFSMEGEPQGEYDYEIFYTYEIQDCKRIKGTVVTLNIPEKLWHVDEDGNRYILVALEKNGKANKYYEERLDGGKNYITMLINKIYE